MYVKQTQLTVKHIKVKKLESGLPLQIFNVKKTLRIQNPHIF